MGRADHREGHFLPLKLPTRSGSSRLCCCTLAECCSHGETELRARHWLRYRTMGRLCLQGARGVSEEEVVIMLNRTCLSDKSFTRRQQRRAQGLCLVRVLKSFTVLISIMKEQIILSLLLFVPTLTQCLPVTADQGGNSHVQLFFCETPGCATDVTHVYCNDKPISSHTGIINCTGLPPPNTLCQHDGRAFISRDTVSVCEFEGDSGYLETKECPDLSNICDSIKAPTSAPISTTSQQNAGEHNAKWGLLYSQV